MALPEPASHNSPVQRVIACIMYLITSDIAPRGRTAPTPIAVAWEWLARPTHYRAVRRFRRATQRGDAVEVASLLVPGISVVVDSGRREPHSIRVVGGVYDAVAVLMHGLADRPGRAVVERSVNGQAGLLVSDDAEATATISIDFRGPLISVVWIRLAPDMLRHWNMV